MYYQCIIQVLPIYYSGVANGLFQLPGMDSRTLANALRKLPFNDLVDK